MEIINITSDDIQSLGVSLLYAEDKQKTIQEFIMHKSLGRYYGKLKQTEKLVKKLDELWS